MRAGDAAETALLRAAAREGQRAQYHGTGEAYTESWCQPAMVGPSAFFTRQAMLQQRMLGPMRSSKVSRM